MQGIFSSDGGYKLFSLTDTIVDTKAATSRKLAVAGVAGVMNVGEVQKNIDANGNPLPLYLYPLRIGGGAANIHIMSFKDNAENIQAGYAYNNTPIPEVSKPNIVDLRHTPRNGLNLYNFDMVGFLKNVEREYYEKLGNKTNPLPLPAIAPWLKQEALKYGQAK